MKKLLCSAAALPLALLSGCYETESPALQSGEKTSLPGTYQCVNRISGQKKQLTFSEKRDGVWPVANYQYIDQDGDLSLFRKTPSGLYVGQSKTKTGRFAYAFVDFVDDKTFLLLSADLLSKGDYIEPLVKKFKLESKSTGEALLLTGPKDRILDFFSAHDRTPLTVVLKCDRTANVATKPPPAQLEQSKPTPALSAPPAQNSRPALPQVAARPSMPPDPAMSFASVKVDPAGTSITASGFVGLRVGHSLDNAALFFGRPMSTDASCHPAFQLATPSGARGVRLILLNGQIVAFGVTDNAYRTKSGMAVGDAESKFVELFGRDPTYQKRAVAAEGHSIVANQADHYLGWDSPVTLLARAKDGVVVNMVFGSPRHIHRMADCLK